MAKVTVTWKAFGNRQNRQISSVTIEVPNDFVAPQFHNSVMNSIYQDTNLYRGFYWNLIEPLLSPNRTHTSLSIGDEITIGEQTYVCADFGWLKVEDANIKYLSGEYGDGAVFSVTQKVGA